MQQNLFGQLSTEDFLQNYWQKKPVVIRGAFPDFEMPFSAEELAGLVCDTDVPARIIMEKGLPPENQPWQVKNSPLSDNDFLTLPDSHCTFVVNDLERYIPELGNLIEPFRFIPDWRIDDLMVSYAEDKGSVGPHTDEYDVFLIQGAGRRRWQIITRDDYPKDLIPDLPIAILKEFEADEEWLLEPGDMLYLPPNIPHYGIAEGQCFTFSVGFRAPRTVDLLQSWLETLSQNKELEQRFSDAERKPQENPGEITAQDLAALSQQMFSAIDQQKSNINIFLGKHLTETRGDLPQIESDSSIQSYHKDSDYERETWLRFAYIEEDNRLHFFADGQHLEFSLDYKEAIQELCEDYFYPAGSLEKLIQNSAFLTLFNTFLANESITPAID